MQTYVFGLCMARGDLRHVLEDNEKVQLELAPTTDEATRAMLSQNYGTEIHAVASCVWIGSPPKPVGFDIYLLCILDFTIRLYFLDWLG